MVVMHGRSMDDDASAISEEAEDELKLQILQDNLVQLSENLNPERFYHYLRASNILSKSDCDEISSRPSHRGRAFVEILITKGPCAYDELCKAILREKTYVYLLKRLNKQFEDRKHKLIHTKKLEKKLGNTRAANILQLPPK